MQVFAGSFRGKVLFENPEYINPNAVRAYEKRKHAGSYDQKVSAKKRRKEHKESNVVEPSELDDRNVFAIAPHSVAARGGSVDRPGRSLEGEPGSDESEQESDDEMDDLG